MECNLERETEELGETCPSTVLSIIHTAENKRRFMHGCFIAQYMQEQSKDHNTAIKSQHIQVGQFYGSSCCLNANLSTEYQTTGKQTSLASKCAESVSMLMSNGIGVLKM
jgi:hypothetical protein